MTAENLFSVVNGFAAAGWLLLILGGRVRRIPALVTGAIIPLLLGVVYIVLIGVNFGSSEGGFGSVREVRALFANDWLLIGGWVHYLAFDLFIGSWQVRDAQRIGIPHLWLIPGLILTFLFGPAGLLVYLAMRAAKTRVIALEG